MVSLISDWDVYIWWSTNTLKEQTNLLFYGHRQTVAEDGTPSPVSLCFSHRNNRGPSHDKLKSSDDDSANDGMNPVLSAAGAKQGTRSSRMNSVKNTGTGLAKKIPCILSLPAHHVRQTFQALIT